ncbi:hypothetical protein EDD85DRAFT_962114 [Armillaria nabsnona]|nr:hypothetical protein EDD85DRAFT_962114 [Armillaria nabsnona]
MIKEVTSHTADKRGQCQPKKLAQALKDVTPFLISILKLSHEDKAHPAASFARDLLYTCETIVTKLPANLQLPIFDGWELWMSKRSGHVKIEKHTPLPDTFLLALSKPKGRKHPASLVNDSGDNDTSGDDDDKEEGDTTSGDNGTGDEGEEELDESEEEILPKHTGGKHAPKFKVWLPGDRPGDTLCAPKNRKLKVPSPKKKFTNPREPEVGLSITVLIGPPKKAARTQPGSVKDEPAPMASSSRGMRTSQRAGIKEEKPVASSSKSVAPATVTIKNKKHLAFGMHQYSREVPVPVKDEEIDPILQALIVPWYGCAQCSFSVQNQACVFLGWGKHCNNCEAATKSLCSFHAEPLQCYFAHKELAKFVEATPDNVHTSIGHTTTALQVFENCANAAAHAAQQYRASLEETLGICQDAAMSKGRGALRGIIFESQDFEEQLRVALLKLERLSPIPLDTNSTHSFESVTAPSFHHPMPRGELPVLPVIEGPGIATLPVPSRKASVVAKGDSGNEVDALIDQITSSPVCPPPDGNDAIQAADTLWEVWNKVIPLETIIDQCKSVCTIGAQLIIHHAIAIIGDQKAEDVCFCMKQAFECILDEHPTIPMFKDYHTVRSFTGTIHSECKKRSAALASAIATVTTPSAPDPAPAAPAKTVATSGKAKASKAPANVVAATKEDTVMGNPDVSNVPQETDSMKINEDVDIIVNRNPTSGNIVEGHKITLPKFLKNKKVAQAAQREKEKAEHHAEAIQAAEVIITKGKANEAAIQARKCPRASADHAFKDSPFTIAAADLAINNEASQSTVNAAAMLVSAGDHVNPSKSILRSREADLCNNVIAMTHKIEYLLKYRKFVVAHHGQVIKQLESHLLVPMEDDSPALVASSSKLD